MGLWIYWFVSEYNIPIPFTDTYCCLEMDTFGHFFMKARTNICKASRDPAWNEDFELELEGSQTLRFLCFKKQYKSHGDLLLGRGALEVLGSVWSFYYVLKIILETAFVDTKYNRYWHRYSFISKKLKCWGSCRQRPVSVLSPPPLSL